MYRALVALAFMTALQAQPQLRLELGFHVGAIKSLATDTAEKFLVTASDDKTVRVNYDCSPGAEESFGFKTNHGDDTPEFMPAVKMRSQYYRPEAVGQGLSPGN